MACNQIWFYQKSSNFNIFSLQHVKLQQGEVMVDWFVLFALGFLSWIIILGPFGSINSSLQHQSAPRKAQHCPCPPGILESFGCCLPGCWAEPWVPAALWESVGAGQALISATFGRWISRAGAAPDTAHLSPSQLGGEDGQKRLFKNHFWLCAFSFGHTARSTEHISMFSG